MNSRKACSRAIQQNTTSYKHGDVSPEKAHPFSFVVLPKKKGKKDSVQQVHRSEGESRNMYTTPAPVECDLDGTPQRPASRKYLTGKEKTVLVHILASVSCISLSQVLSSYKTISLVDISDMSVLPAE